MAELLEFLYTRQGRSMPRRSLLNSGKNTRFHSASCIVVNVVNVYDDALTTKLQRKIRGSSRRCRCWLRPSPPNYLKKCGATLTGSSVSWILWGLRSEPNEQEIEPNSSKVWNDRVVRISISTPNYAHSNWVTGTRLLFLPWLLWCAHASIC
jgi:hypothetical protein